MIYYAKIFNKNSNFDLQAGKGSDGVETTARVRLTRRETKKYRLKKTRSDFGAGREVESDQNKQQSSIADRSFGLLF